MAPLSSAPAASGHIPSAPTLRGQGTDVPRVHSQDLLQGGNLILIEHGGERYFLRMTRNNKLILTK